MRREYSDFGSIQNEVSSTGDMMSFVMFFSTFIENSFYIVDFKNELDYAFSVDYNETSSNIRVSEGVNWDGLAFLPYKPASPSGLSVYEMFAHITVNEINNPLNLTFKGEINSYNYESYSIANNQQSLKGIMNIYLNIDGSRILVGDNKYMTESDVSVSVDDTKFKTLYSFTGGSFSVQSNCKNNCTCDDDDADTNKNLCHGINMSTMCSDPQVVMTISSFPQQIECVDTCPTTCQYCPDNGTGNCNCVDVNDQKSVIYLDNSDLNSPECRNCRLPICYSNQFNNLDFRGTEVKVEETPDEPATIEPGPILEEFDYISEFEVFKPKTECFQNCKKCRVLNNQIECQMCENGFEWDSYTKTCYQKFNSKYDRKCWIMVEDVNICVIYNGFIKNNISNFRMSCPSNCFFCQVPRECLFCKPEYLNVDGQCVKGFRDKSRGFQQIPNPVYSRYFVNVYFEQETRLYFDEEDIIKYLKYQVDYETEKEFRIKNEIIYSKGVMNPDIGSDFNPQDWDLIREQDRPKKMIYKAYIPKAKSESESCKTISMKGFCRDCQDGYSFDPLSRNCVLISAETYKAVFVKQTGKMKIMSCADNHFSSSKFNRCLPNIGNCLEMSRDGTCKKCLDGFQPSPSRSQCISCSKDCRSCMSSTNCLQCRESFFLEKLNLHSSCKNIIYQVV